MRIGRCAERRRRRRGRGRAAERDIRAEERGSLGSRVGTAAWSFFFCPSAGDLRYFNIEFSPSGACIWASGGASRSTRGCW